MNEILKAIRANPRVLFEICQIKELNTRGLFPVEVEAFLRLEREAHAKSQFRYLRGASRYYRHLSDLQRRLLRLETDYMVNRPALAGMGLYAEMSRVVNGMTGEHYTARQCRDELDLATEILIDLELGRFVAEKVVDLVEVVA